MSLRPKPKPGVLTVNDMKGILSTQLEDAPDAKLTAELLKRGYTVQKTSSN